jgi:hypothetical protein
VEIDHVFVCCSPGAPEADSLVRLGLREGAGSAHAGQGTANRRFFFAGFYLELLWVADDGEARGEAVRRTGLWERCCARASGASPFGVLLRPSHEGEQPPFPTWRYRPPYLPAGTSIAIADGLPLHEPLLAVLPFARTSGWGAGQPTDHALPWRDLDCVQIAVPDPGARSAAARAASGAVRLTFVGGEPLMDLVFHNDPGVVHDLRPTLPLRLRGA